MQSPNKSNNKFGFLDKILTRSSCLAKLAITWILSKLLRLNLKKRERWKERDCKIYFMWQASDMHTRQIAR